MAIQVQSEAGPAAPAAARPPVTREGPRAGWGAWYAVLFLTVAASLSSVDRQVLALMIGPIKRDFSVSDSQMGLLGGLAFSLLYTAFTLPAAWVADQRSRRMVVTAGILFWSAMTSACGLAHRFVTLFLARMGVGIGEAALGPAAYSMMSDLFPRASLPVAIGLYNAAPFIGVGLANMVGGPMIQHFEGAPPITLPLLGAVKSWQTVFLILGVPGLAMALLGRLTLAEPARRGRFAGDGHIPLTLSQIGAFLAGRRLFLTLMFTAYVALAIQGWGLFFWVVEFLVRERGLARGQVGLIYGSMAFGLGLAGAIVSGRLASSLLRRGDVVWMMRLVFLCILVLGPLAIVMPLAPRGWEVLALLAPITFLMGWPGGLGTTALQFIVPNELKGRIIALYLVVVNFISLTLGPLLGGLISDRVFAGRSLGGSLCLMAAVDYPLAAVCLWFCLRPFREAVDKAAAWEAAG
jgi:MFS family permease